MFIIVLFSIVMKIMIMIMLGSQKKQPVGNRAKKCMHGKRKSRYHCYYYYYYYYYYLIITIIITVFIIVIMTIMIVILIMIVLCRCMTCKSLSQEEYLRIHGYVTWNQVFFFRVST
jgi:hypothetical protein